MAIGNEAVATLTGCPQTVISVKYKYAYGHLASDGMAHAR